jgi:AraC-like DNA-binding protein
MTKNSWRKELFDDLLRGIRLKSSVYFRPEFKAPWGVHMARDCAVFHIVASGGCWLQVNGAAPVALAEGDFIVVTRGSEHSLRDQLSTPTSDFFQLLKSHDAAGNGAFGAGGDGAVTRLVCGGMEFADPAIHPLLTILPPVLHVKRTETGPRMWLGLTTQYVLSELERAGAGAEEVVTRLADILFIQAVRAYFEENVDSAGSGWLAAARDPQIGRALAMLHGHPHRPWTVNSLADQQAMSRSAFAARFTSLVGEPPLRYCTRLRIHAAAARLRAGDEKLSAVAAEVGYASVAAFVRSFKRYTGMTPGEYRNARARSLDDCTLGRPEFLDDWQTKADSLTSTRC